MNMDPEYSTHSHTRNGAASGANRNTGKTKGRYLKEQPKPAHRRRRRRRLNPRFVILVSGLLAILIGIILGVRSCSKPSIIGRWDLDGTTVYRFEKDGKGALELMVGEYAFTYKIEDDTLKIDFIDDVAIDSSYTFEINRNILFLTGGPGDAKMDYALQKRG